MPQARRRLDKGSGVPTGRFTGEAFHFVSFVPINGHLFELDGLKPYPMDHGPWGENEDWTDKFRRIMADRLGISSGEQDIRFNLMAVVPDRRIAITHKLKMLKTNKEIVTAALNKIIKDKEESVKAENRNKMNLDIVKLEEESQTSQSSDPSMSSSSMSSNTASHLSYKDNTQVSTANKTNIFDDESSHQHSDPSLLESSAFAPKDLLALLNNLESEIKITEQHLSDENDKRNMFKIDDCRRTHNYDEFICTFLSLLAHDGALGELVSQHLICNRKTPGNRIRNVYKKNEKSPKSPGVKRRRGRNKCKRKK